MSHWYAIQVTSGKEESTCRLMRRLVSAAVLEEVYRFFGHPMER